MKLAVRTQNGEQIPKDTMLSLMDTHGKQVGAADLDESGRCTIADVLPGDYRLNVDGDRRSWNVTALSADGKDQPNRMLRVTGTKAVAAAVTISSYVTEVDGLAKLENKPAVGSMVVLVPEGADTNEQLFRRDQTDLDGSFTFFGVTPGKYRVIAINDGWTLRWNDRAALAPYLTKSTALTIPPRGSAKTVLADVVGAQSR